ncbi:hypothetical protein ACSYAY_06005 [Leptospirillum ferriphilum]|uniref:hypothetical protein n=1 Tax=Leptospirillum ferriphilum TaxID=178606 RepID=UPI003EE752B3
MIQGFRPSLPRVASTEKNSPDNALNNAREALSGIPGSMLVRKEELPDAPVEKRAEKDRSRTLRIPAWLSLFW